MMGLPNWLRGREGDYDMTHDEVPVPKIANLEIKKPLPFHIAPRDDDQAAAVVAQAHSYIEQWKIERVAQQKENEQLKSDLKAEKLKSELLDLDIAQHLNTIATLQSEIIALKEREGKYRQFLSVKKQINEKERLTYEQFQIDDPPKPERKAKPKKKADRESTTETSQADG